MSTGTFHEGSLTIGSTQASDKCVTISSVFGYDLRTVDQHIAALERDIAQLRQLLADQGMMIAQLRELVTGQPPFLAPEGNWTLNE